MKTKIHSKQHFAFPVVIIFALCLQVNANHTEYPGVINETWNPISQNLSGSQNIMEANTNPPTTINFNGKAMTTEMQTATPQSLSSTMGQNSSISSSSRSTVSAAGGPKNTSKPKTTWSKEMCEDTQQGKRRPRSNGDILATNSLWPTAAGTWQKMPKEEAGTDLIMQELLAGRDAAIQRKTQDQTTERITRETDKHENEELKSHKNILTNFVVEI
uniref:Ecotropic viral integration site 2A n=1 Tax=Anas platyrhynchos platyrhynchos TaxID=8840 RepID=A0A493TN59_ANAPP